MIERLPLLTREPGGRIVNLEALVGLANAIEAEAVARYGQLAATMEARGEAATAAVFRDMQAFEASHVESVARLASRLQQKVPPAEGFTWLLPPEIAESWETVQHSALLTPYRALAIAVTNEERAFALYSYLAAHAEDAEVAQQAEALAREELSHAAELRVRRRLAWRRESPASGRSLADGIGSLDDFHAIHAHLQRQAADAHRAIATALVAAGDAESARLVDALAAREEEVAAPAGDPSARLLQDVSPEGLLQQALKPLETASEVYEDVAAQAVEEEMLQASQAALHRVVEAISVLGRRLNQLEALGGHPQP